jgi:hypothetical protein
MTPSTRAPRREESKVRLRRRHGEKVEESGKWEVKVGSASADSDGLAFGSVNGECEWVDGRVRGQGSSEKGGRRGLPCS